MLHLCNLFLGCCLLYAVFQSAQGRPSCLENEEYVQCVNVCNTCVDRGYCPESGSCEPGCDCLEGYFRNREGLCVSEHQCDDPTAEPCGQDEEFRECSCVRSCCNRGNPVACSRQCLTGCFCREGLVRDRYGNCIPLEDCPRNCSRYEQYYTNKPDCKNTCRNYSDPTAVCPPGGPGCFCREGLVLRRDGRCVRPEECVREMCGRNEEYSECGSACPATCENYGRPRTCILRCVPGCFCREGFVRSNGGRCIRPEMCPQRNCSRYEQYYRNKPDCKNTCRNFSDPTAVCPPGGPGCFCREGLVLRSDRRCVRPEECVLRRTPGNCSRYEQYYKNKPDCKNTCRNYSDPTAVCPPGGPGCFCREGLVLRNDGRCVRPEGCVREICGRNEEYRECGSACPATCDNYDRPRVCSRSCVAGCFCADGFVRRNNGRCIRPEMCPQRNCSRYEQYYRNKPDCKNTCRNYSDPTAVCPPGGPGCFCREGLVLRSDGRCVRPEGCVRGNCSRYEQYYSNKPDCKNTCRNYSDPSAVCPPGGPGCFCREGLVLRNDGRCVRPEGCVRGNCSRYEQYYSSKPDCKNTCRNYSDPAAVCRPGGPGCFCREGLVLRRDGRCVRPEECVRGNCSRYEQFYSNKPDCKNTCRNYSDPTAVCPPGGPGCFCREGLVMRSDGRCVRPEGCVRGNCSRYEQYYSNKPDCKNTCQNYSNPTAVCHPGGPGCFCREGLVLRNDGRCVRPQECISGKTPEYERRYSGARSSEGQRRYSRSEGQREYSRSEGQKEYSRSEGQKEYSRSEDRSRYSRSEGESEYSSSENRSGYSRSEGQRGYSGAQRSEGQREYSRSEGQREYSRSEGESEYSRSEDRSGYSRSEGERGYSRSEGQRGYSEFQTSDYGRRYSGTQSSEYGRGYSRAQTSADEKGYSETQSSGEGGYTSETVNNSTDEGSNRVVCSANEEYSSCGTACPPTCRNRNPICIAMCREGCFCKKGYIRESQGGSCIPEGLCSQDHCGPNETYSSCASVCPPTCGYRDGICAARRVCVAGCECVPGYILHHLVNGRCIPEDQCPEDESSPCPLINCLAGCYLDYTSSPCPTCACNTHPEGSSRRPNNTGENAMNEGYETTTYEDDMERNYLGDNRAYSGSQRSESERAYSGSQRSESERAYSGSQSSVGERVYSGSQRSEGERERSGSQRSAGERTYSGSQRSESERAYSGSQRSVGERAYSGSQRSEGERESSGSQRSAGERTYSGSQRSERERAYSGSQRSVGERAYSGSQRSEGERENSGSQRSAGESTYSGSQRSEGESSYSGSQRSESERAYSGSQRAVGERAYSGSQRSEGERENSRSQLYEGERSYSGSQSFEGERSYSGSQSFEGERSYTGSQRSGDEESEEESGYYETEQPEGEGYAVGIEAETYNPRSGGSNADSRSTWTATMYVPQMF